MKHELPEYMGHRKSSLRGKFIAIFMKGGGGERTPINNLTAKFKLLEKRQWDRKENKE